MNGKYAVAIDGKIVTWEDGEFKSDDKALEKALCRIEYAEKSKPYLEITLDGSLLYSGEWRKPSENWALSYGFLQGITGGDMEFVAGDRPTWEKLGQELPDGAVP